MKKGRRIQFLVIFGLWVAAFIWLSGGTRAERFLPVALDEKEFLQVKVFKLLVDPTSRQPVVLLADSLEEHAIPMWIGPCEADAINAVMQGIKPSRPLTHDLLERTIQRMEGKVQWIAITHLKDGIYHATMGIERKGSLIEIDARPSDSLVLALKFKASVFVSKKLFSEAAIPLKEKNEIEEQYGLTLQELTPLLAQSFSFKSTRGALVSFVREGSQAEKDGIKRGDIFVEVGGKAIEDMMSLKNALSKARTPVQAKTFREGNFLTITLHLKGSLQLAGKMEKVFFAFAYKGQDF